MVSSRPMEMRSRANLRRNSLLTRNSKQGGAGVGKHVRGSLHDNQQSRQFRQSLPCLPRLATQHDSLQAPSPPTHSLSIRMTRSAPRANAQCAVSRPTAHTRHRGAAQQCMLKCVTQEARTLPQAPCHGCATPNCHIQAWPHPAHPAPRPRRPGGRRAHQPATQHITHHWQHSSPGPAPQMATRSPGPTSPSSHECQAVGRMSDSSTWVGRQERWLAGGLIPSWPLNFFFRSGGQRGRLVLEAASSAAPDGGQPRWRSCLCSSSSGSGKQQAAVGRSTSRSRAAAVACVKRTPVFQLTT